MLPKKIWGCCLLEFLALALGISFRDLRNKKDGAGMLSTYSFRSRGAH